MIRLIALDVDGTLLTPQGTVSPETVKAVGEARARGVHVALCTGRSAPEAAWFSKLTGCGGRAVCLGGAAIADVETYAHLRQWDMPRETALAALDLVEPLPLALMVFSGEINLMNTASDRYFTANYPYDCYHDHKTVVENVAAWVRETGKPITKIYGVGDSALFAEILPKLRAMPGVELTSSGKENFEVMPLGVDKGAALRVLAEEWGVAMEETAAVGDSDNDLAALAAVGYPVAMGNATAQVKARAKWVTASNAEDGVAKAIRHLLGQA
ncbi:MAG: Cof-type HAD-IIB family hydrolase [Clostridia bacterium]|nr:Cof-type HAD-IIB family hydrolase [Clostridia bacterium]